MNNLNEYKMGLNNFLQIKKVNQTYGMKLFFNKINLLFFKYKQFTNVHMKLKAPYIDIQQQDDEKGNTIVNLAIYMIFHNLSNKFIFRTICF